MRNALLFTILSLFLSGGPAAAFSDGPQTQPKERGALSEALGSDEDAGYRRATRVRPFTFPADHGPHPDFKQEWWYFTGNLRSAEGRRFGFQLTFFRIALAPQPIERPSNWGTRQIYMAHFALTDAAGERFFSFERFSRAAVELAGAELGPVKIWLETWQARGAEQGLFPLQLKAAEDEVTIDLTLEQGKSLVLQGEKGLSQKSAEAGNASYYYSFTRLPARGTITIGGEDFAVEGSAWLDREWSTSALAPDQVGWDWFALQFADGRDLMYYRLRGEEGGTDPASQGILVAPDGTAQKLAAGDVELEVLETWRSPDSDAVYPVSWRLHIPARQIDLEIRPLIPNQELQTTLRYWEGAVSVTGRDAEEKINGWGYVELTGYD